MFTGVYLSFILKPILSRNFVPSKIDRKFPVLGKWGHNVKFCFWNPKRHILVRTTSFDVLTVIIGATALREAITELQWLDMSINVNKSARFRIGHRHRETCYNLVTLDERELWWVNTFRYLGVYQPKRLDVGLQLTMQRNHFTDRSILGKSAVRLLNKSQWSCWKPNVYRYSYMAGKFAHPLKPR